MRKVPGLVGVTLLFATPALAADLGRPPPPVPVAPVYLSDWAGFYIGINGGYGWGDMKFDDAPILDAKPRGGLFGGHAGYNWQYGSVVGGLEVDFDGADIKESSDIGTIQRIPVTREAKIDELASARARLGYTVYPGLLAYGTAGLGWGHSELTLSHPFLGAVSADSNEFGWTAGAGLEYKFMEHILLRAEYLHYDFAKDDMGAKTTVDVIRGGLSYKF